LIEWKCGDLLAEPAEALVNAVNCVGAMGRGVALQFKRAFPENFGAYHAACARGKVQPGRMFVFARRAASGPRVIVNFPTKRHWRDRARIEDVGAGLVALAAEVEARAIRSIALPALGAGLGGLAWAQVRDRIAHSLGGLTGVRVIVFEPHESE
jgi:O-acetyl-ADP-ribose deacetylase (regulator of RNase III)